MKNRFRILVAVVGMVVILASLVLTGCGNPAAVSNPASKPAANSVSVLAPDAIASAAPDKGPQEGIKVHGHWTIEVTNPDGTLAERTEFENALSPEGSEALCNILARVISVGGWMIDLNNSSGSNPWYPGVGARSNEGYIDESTQVLIAPYISKNLSIASDSGNLTLSGTINALHDGEIDWVITYFYALPNTSPPSQSYESGNGWYILTETLIVDPATKLPSPVMLTAGQQVAVTVVISFS